MWFLISTGIVLTAGCEIHWFKKNYGADFNKSGQNNVVLQLGHFPVVGNNTSGWLHKKWLAQQSIWPFSPQNLLRHFIRGSS